MRLLLSIAEQKMGEVLTDPSNVGQLYVANALFYNRILVSIEIHTKCAL